MVKVIGLGECEVSRDRQDSIKTYALASCVGLVVYDCKEKVLGMVHIVLPDTKDSDSNGKAEGFFADTAVPLVFGKVFGRYPDKETAYRVSLFGGCDSRNAKDIFNVGQRNVARVEQLLQAHCIEYDKTNTGGHYSRTIEAYVENGAVLISKQMMMM